ncbi:MAG: hypothetical protein C4530_23025 [Desulfobacteraceae bacterium]|nr:MAG: hypothetical protein C4530_23025 [Desulfobacteraceae bacterium]
MDSLIIGMEHLKSKRLLSYATLICALISGCVPMATDLRKIGFNEIQKGFASLDKTPDLHEVIELKEVKVHVVGDRKYFKWEKAAAYGSPVAGYATTGNEIYVFGKMVNGKIVVNQAILGHELNHLLNFKNQRIANPDRLDDLGA